MEPFQCGVESARHEARHNVLAPLLGLNVLSNPGPQQCWSRELGMIEIFALVWGSQCVAGENSSSLEKFLFN